MLVFGFAGKSSEVVVNEVKAVSQMARPSRMGKAKGQVYPQLGPIDAI